MFLPREPASSRRATRADQAVFPLRQDRIGIARHPVLIAFVVIPLTGVELHARRSVHDPVPDLLARGDRAQHPHRLYRPALARHRRASWASAPMPATSSRPIFPDVNIIVLDPRCRGSSPPRSAWCSACRRCASRASISRSRRSRRSSSWHGASSAFRGSTTTTSPARSRCRPARSSASPITGPNATPMTRYFVVLGIVVVMTWLASNLVHGRIGRMWMAVRDMDIAAELIGIRLLPDQAARLRGVVVLLRRRRRDDGVPLARRRRGRRLQHQPVAS